MASLRIKRLFHFHLEKRALESLWDFFLPFKQTYNKSPEEKSNGCSAGNFFVAAVRDFFMTVLSSQWLLPGECHTETELLRWTHKRGELKIWKPHWKHKIPFICPSFVCQVSATHTTVWNNFLEKFKNKKNARKKNLLLFGHCQNLSLKVPQNYLDWGQSPPLERKMSKSKQKKCLEHFGSELDPPPPLPFGQSPNIKHDFGYLAEVGCRALLFGAPSVFMII